MTNKGVLYAFSAYFFWGLTPIYWKWLKQIAAAQLIGHRIIWSFILLVAVLLATRNWPEFRGQTSDRKVLPIYFIAAALLAGNWFIYVWSVNAGYIVEASLGYFINPLLSVLLGVIFLREHLRLFQWISVLLAAVGVGYLTFAYGNLPWIALSLAFTFGFYGLIKKTSPLNSLYGLTLETGVLFIPALLFLSYQDWLGQGAFLRTGLVSDLLMAGAGLVTTVPLLMFASAAQRIPLTTIGILHYITPTCQFLLGVLVYQEVFDIAKAIGFAIVWAGLIIFGVEGILSRRTILAKPVPELGKG